VALLSRAFDMDILHTLLQQIILSSGLLTWIFSTRPAVTNRYTQLGPGHGYTSHSPVATHALSQILDMYILYTLLQQHILSAKPLTWIDSHVGLHPLAMVNDI
jgi:hypothetical protein